MNGAVTLFVCVCAYLNLAGWALSAIHELNPAGCLIALLPGLVAVICWRGEIWGNGRLLPRRASLRRRLGRPFPAFFFLVAALVFLGGALYAPTNYDGLTYRLPRTLHWLAKGGWNWIPTANLRMNLSGPAWEWTALPQLALLHSDRGLFLIDFAGFLLLPGLLFSVFSGMGVARRVAWTWMWILPLGYGYALQAGSIGNDLMGTVLVLASVHFGLRARHWGRASDIWLCGLSAALLTGTKLSNLPLLLPCLVAVWPALPRLRDRWRASMAMLFLTGVISALPIMLLNQLNTGHWSGDPTNKYGMQIHNPVAGLAGNGMLVAEGSLMPPVLPGAHHMDALIFRLMPESAHRWLVSQFPRLLLNRLNEMPGEEGAGLGLGVSLPLVLGLLAAIFFRSGKASWRPNRKWFLSIGLGAWVAFLFAMAKMGSEAGARLLLPYYPLVIAPLLAQRVHCRLLFFSGWRWLLALGAGSVLVPLLLSPNRPLWPAVHVSEEIARRHPGNAGWQRMAEVYSGYANRNDVLASVRAALPADARQIGLVAGPNDTEYSLWRPFGQRQVLDLTAQPAQFLNDPSQADWVVVKDKDWPEFAELPLAEWTANHGFRVIFSTNLVELVSGGAERWSLLHKEK